MRSLSKHTFLKDTPSQVFSPSHFKLGSEKLQVSFFLASFPTFPPSTHTALFSEIKCKSEVEL